MFFNCSTRSCIRFTQQGEYHEKVVPVVCGLVSDASQPVRVRGHAAAAIVNFTDTDGVPEEAVAPHLDSLLSALCSCLNGGVPQSVQVCVRAISCRVSMHMRVALILLLVRFSSKLDY